jgi:hypothetical protein
MPQKTQVAQGPARGDAIKPTGDAGVRPPMQSLELTTVLAASRGKPRSRHPPD